MEQFDTDAVPAKKTYSTGEVAKMLHVAPRTVQKLFDSDQLDGYRMGENGGGDRHIFADSLAAFMKARNIPNDVASRAVLSPGEVVKVLHVAPCTVCNLFDSGQLDGYRIGINSEGDRYIFADSLAAFMEAHNIPNDVASRAVLSPGEVAAILHVDPHTVQKLFDSDQLDGYRIGINSEGNRYIFADSVVGLAKRRGVSVPEDLLPVQIPDSGSPTFDNIPAVWRKYLADKALAAGESPKIQARIMPRLLHISSGDAWTEAQWQELLGEDACVPMHISAWPEIDTNHSSNRLPKVVILDVRGVESPVAVVERIRRDSPVTKVFAIGESDDRERLHGIADKFHSVNDLGWLGHDVTQALASRVPLEISK